MIVRNIINQIHKALNRQAAVALIGPRQVGKTTLAIQVAERTPSIYLDLEGIEDRDRLRSPALFFNRNKSPIIKIELFRL